jgi:hypothetical protein
MCRNCILRLIAAVRPVSATNNKHDDRIKKRVRVAQTKYYVYVIELDKEFALTTKAREANPKQDLKKPCIYVGSSSKTPEERFREHIKGARNSRGPLFSRVVYRYGKRLLPNEYRKYNPISTREEAQEMEKNLTEEYRKRGYTVWSN